MFGENLKKSLVRSATHRPLIDPHFKIVLAYVDHAGLFRVRSHMDLDQHTSNNYGQACVED